MRAHAHTPTHTISLPREKKNSSNVGGIEQSLFWHDETLLYIIDIVESIYIIDIFETIYIIDIVLIYIIDIIWVSPKNSFRNVPGENLRGLCVVVVVVLTDGDVEVNVGLGDL